MPVGVRLLALVLACTAWCLGAGPAQAVPSSVGLHLSDLQGVDKDAPFVGEEFVAESDPVDFGPGGRSGWVCAVDFGDGTTGGGWRGHEWEYSQPCAEWHSYAAGTYTLTMTITDPLGNSVSEQKTVHVVPRAVTARDGGVEGSKVTLAAPAGADQVDWMLAGEHPRCSLRRTGAHDAVIRCHDEGTYRVTYDTGEASTSGAYDVTFVNGGPRPTLVAKRTRLNAQGIPYEVRVGRVGTGDAVAFNALTHDPSVFGHDGDRFTCTFDYGNGTTDRVVSRTEGGRCRGESSYPRPGRYVTTLKVDDGDGASATTRTSVVVVRRDVHVTVRDVGRGLAGGAVTASLTPRGLVGDLSVNWRDGHSLVASHLGGLSVYQYGAARFEGRGLFDGKPGYSFSVNAYVKEEQGIALTVQVWRTGHPKQVALSRRLGDGQFRVRLDARRVS